MLVRRANVRFAYAKFVVVALLVGAAFVSATTACGRSEADKRAEVATVTVAIDRLRDAPNPNKKDFLLLAKAAPCSLPDVCAFRELCVAAYTLQVEALAQIAQVKLGAAPSGDPAAHLLSIQDSLAKARDAARTCVDEEAKLLERYRAK